VKKDTFCNQLTSDAGSACTNRRTNGDLLFSRGSPNQHQVCDIGTGDQQNERDCSEEYQKQSSDIAHNIVI